jgi:4-hydroxybenzoate polyprenyltransferase
LQARSDSQPLWRTFLVLGRVSNLPTVWSNCLAGWLLAGGAEWPRFFVLCAGTSLLYIAGMFLNDACDSQFDIRHRPERPIPSGAITAPTVFLLSIVWFTTGLLLLASLGIRALLPALALVACIVLYDVLHKKTALAPVLMAACRFLLYILAASTATAGISQDLFRSAGALAFYILGVSYLARRESADLRINHWALLLLLAPLVASFLWNGVPADARYALSIALFVETGSIGRAVAGLLAGIVFVDLLALQGAATALPAMAILFVTALLLQRTIPAT